MNAILPIVEGDGDARAVPILVRRILESKGIYIQVLAANKRGDLPKIRGSFENYFRAAIKFKAPILWVLDFDCDDCNCQKEEAEKLYKRANDIYENWPFKVVFISKEFEALFLAEKNTARTVLGIDDSFEFPANPNSIRGAKSVLSHALPKGRAYKETVHQQKIAAQIDLDILREVSSDFRHLEKSVLFLANHHCN